MFEQKWASESTLTYERAFSGMLGKVLPDGQKMLNGRYSVQVLLRENQGCVHKAFVYAIRVMSQWIGADRFPQGIYVWPPHKPKGDTPVTAATPHGTCTVGGSSGSAEPCALPAPAAGDAPCADVQ